MRRAVGWLAVGWLSGCVTNSSSQQIETAPNMLAELSDEMVTIPAGQFLMGNPSEHANANAHPAHEVSIQSFNLSKYEMTFAQYDVFARATQRPLPDDGGWGRSQRPVIHVTWEDAQAFAAWVSAQTGRHFRLPSEAEWEYAARAGSNADYPWGDAFNDALANSNAKSDGWRATAPVGEFPPNAFGLYDMLGNVWEWLADCANYDYRDAPGNGAARIEGDCALHAVRGGSWYDDPNDLRVFVRNWDENSVQLIDLGFRLAEDL